jgi:DNA-directed RNA polymerase specialized sigma24 family protein
LTPPDGYIWYMGETVLIRLDEGGPPVPALDMGEELVVRLEDAGPLLAACPALRERIGRNLEDEGKRLPPEATVSLYRGFWRLECFDLSGRCATLLLGRPLPDGRCRGGWCEPIIRRTAREFGLARDPELLKDFRQKCYHDVLDALDGREKGRPWDARFFLALKWAVQDAGRTMIRDVKRVKQSVPLDAPEVTERSQDPEIASDLDVRVALRNLPDSQRKAVWLHWVECIPVESNDPTQPTVATLMRKSGRMVRKYLRAARATLKTDPTVAELARERNARVGA